ncbi:MAG TPA: ImmA/IrrE family metallo-endopeptidase [Blastocatellia bacterium]
MLPHASAQRRVASDRFLVEAFSQWIPGWGRRQLGWSDLEALCTDLGIELIQAHLKDADGYAFWVDGTPYIFVADHLSGPEKVIAGFHELCHILYHSEHSSIFRRCGNLWNWSKCDRQAEIVGAVAWMPDVRGLSVEEVMEEFGVSRDVALFRSQVILWEGFRSVEG